MPYEWILTETHGQVGLITINRPQAMNALNNQLMPRTHGRAGGFR